MIIKGSSRAGPEQLARHLLRTDTNETVRVLHVDFSAGGDLTEALVDMQELTDAIRGKKGLYHANIDPEARYEMTEDQWRRAVEVLEEELGLQGQPKAIVLHKKEDREHLHIVWARTDMELWKLRSDSMNYPAHERASMALEQEFGHDHTPGKHVKRDPDPDIPTPVAGQNHLEWQQKERTGLDPIARKELITDLYHQSDTGRAFRAALEDAGYILARGDTAPYVVVDRAGEPHSLTRQINGVRAGPIKDLVADLDYDALPTAEQARETARQRAIDDLAGQAIREATVGAEQAPQTPATPEPDTGIERALQHEHDRLARDRETFLDDQKLLASGLERQWQEEREKREAAIDRRLAAQRQREFDDLMARKRKRPANLNDEMREFWEVLQTKHNPYRALSRKATREKFWAELQPVLDQRDALLRTQALAKFDARIDGERQRLRQDQAAELERFETKQSSDLYEAQRQIEADAARRAREAERAKEIERHLRESDIARQKDKDRDRK